MPQIQQPLTIPERGEQALSIKNKTSIPFRVYLVSTVLGGIGENHFQTIHIVEGGQVFIRQVRFLENLKQTAEGKGDSHQELGMQALRDAIYDSSISAFDSS